MKKIDLYNNFYDDYYENVVITSSYPKFVSWKNPEDGHFRNRILRDDAEYKVFFEWFLSKYPDINYTIE